jgi:hypothetical protein
MNPIRPRRHAAGAAVAGLVAVAALLVGACTTPPTSHPTTTTTTTSTTAPSSPDQLALDRGGDWVLSQFDATGTMPGFDPAYPDTGNAVLGVADLAALGKGQATAATRLSRLESDFEDYVDQGDGDRPGALARVIMAVVAAGGNPRSFGGTDLVARLEATEQPNGLFGTQYPNFDAAFRQGLALAALSLVTPRPASITPGAGQTIDDVPAVAWLRSQQCTDGSWLMYRASTVGDCVEDPANFTYKDSNGSALAVLGLEAVGATAAVDPAGWFDAVRGNDGGWGSSPSGPTQVSDADSTGLVIAALKSLGDTPDPTATAALRSLQLDDSAPAADQGAFEWRPDVPGANRLATLDAITGLFDGVWPGVLTP